MPFTDRHVGTTHDVGRHRYIGQISGKYDPFIFFVKYRFFGFLGYELDSERKRTQKQEAKDCNMPKYIKYIVSV